VALDFRGYATLSEDGGLTERVRFYNKERGRSSIEDRTPDEVYYGLPHPFAEAA